MNTLQYTLKSCSTVTAQHGRARMELGAWLPLSRDGVRINMNFRDRFQHPGPHNRFKNRDGSPTSQNPLFWNEPNQEGWGTLTPRPPGRGSLPPHMLPSRGHCSFAILSQPGSPSPEESTKDEDRSSQATSSPPTPALPL